MLYHTSRASLGAGISTPKSNHILPSISKDLIPFKAKKSLHAVNAINSVHQQHLLFVTTKDFHTLLLNIL